jgi:hypothetical protein
MKNKRLFILLAFVCIFLSASVFAATNSFPSVCCEKTNSGAFCINTKQEDCAPIPFRNTPSSCSQTSYCRQGTCYDSREGICMENVPQLLCNGQNGTWIDKPIEQVPQCNQGCCIIADQASFVSLVRCKRLSSFFGVSINFRTDIADEVSCIAAAQSQDMGACVFEQEFERTCKFTTRGECNAPDGIIDATGSRSTTNSSEKKFYKNYLCSAEALNTICGRQTDTGCYQGNVYWFDSCGNRENIYSSDKQKSWNDGKAADEKTTFAYAQLNNGDNKNNGNCDYLKGARCAEYKGIIGGPQYGNFYCKRTDCKLSEYGEKILKTNKDRKNGESWCQYDTNVGKGLDAVGSRHFRYICIDGEVKVEACDDLRARVCFQNNDISDGTGSNFSTAACRVNRWQDCLSQTEQEECENRDVRECIWINSVRGLNLGSIGTGSGSANLGFSNPTANTGFNNPTTGKVVAPITGNAIFGGGDDKEDMQQTATNRPTSICVPNYPPGSDFWNSGGEASIQCGQVSAKCIVTYEKKGSGPFEGEWECISGCDCLKEQWALNANNICKSIGDCGGYVNWLRKDKFTDNGYVWLIDGQKQKLSPNTKNVIISGLTGKAIGVDIVQKLGEEK